MRWSSWKLKPNRAPWTWGVVEQASRASGQGEGLQELYVDDLVDEHTGFRLDELKLVLDCANGAASWYAPPGLFPFKAQRWWLCMPRQPVSISAREGGFTVCSPAPVI